MGSSRDDAIEHFLRTGRFDMDFALWPGEDFAACSRNAHAALRNALIDAVHARARHATLPVQLADLDVVAFARAKLAPMVRGLFARVEQEAVLDVLGNSLVFLTPATVDTAIERMPWPGTAWDIANLYLEGCGVPRLAEDAPCLVGLSDGTRCYVSPEYFSAAGRFDDFVVHEAAHIFHNCKRASIGLRGTRRREWLLEIDFSKRETFAYACEAFSRIQALGDSPRSRRRLLDEHEQAPPPPDARVDAAEYYAILREAIAARNGWKAILARCAPAAPARPLARANAR